MPETPFDPALMPVAGAFSEPAAIKAHAEMLNQINVLSSDRDTWRRLCREAQAEVRRLRADWERLNKLLSLCREQSLRLECRANTAEARLALLLDEKREADGHL